MSSKKTLVTWLLGGALLLVMSVISSREVAAETVKARRSTSVFAAQGEKSKVLTRVRAGKTMTVLRRSGRWIKVRVNGLTGWITRSNIEVVAGRSAPQKNREVSFVEGRSRRDKDKNGPDDRIGADAVDGANGGGGADVDNDDSNNKAKAKRDREREKKAEKAKREKAKREKAKREKAKREKAKKRKRVAARERKAKKRKRRGKRKGKRKADEFEDEDEDDDGDFNEDEDGDGDGDEDSSEDEDEVVVVTAEEAELYKKPSRKAKSVDFAEEGDKLLVLDREGDWILVETPDGDEGWVREGDVGTAGFTYKKLAKAGFAVLGYRAVSQSFVSDSTDPLGNYKVSSGAAFVGVGGDLIYDYSEKYLVGGELSFGYTRANPGVRFNDPNTMQPVDISFTILQARAVGKGGYKLSDKTGMAAYLRVGYHYEKFDIGNVADIDGANAARLPSEILQGAFVGASLDVPRFNEKWSGRITLDYMSTTTLGKRQQTQDLQDGNLSDVSSIWGAARVQYQWKPNMQIAGTYQYYQGTTNFEGRPMNSRRRHIENDPGASCPPGSCNREDKTHTVFVGILRSF